MKPTKILFKYGPLENPDKYTIDVLDYYVKHVYEDFYNKDYPLEDTEINFNPCLSSVPYSITDRASMPLNYLCMGSLPVTFQSPSGSISPIAFVDFRHTSADPPHHNTYIYWRKPDGSTKKCFDDEIEGHDEIRIEDDLVISLVFGEKKVFEGIIPGKK